MRGRERRGKREIEREKERGRERGKEREADGDDYKCSVYQCSVH